LTIVYLQVGNTPAVAIVINESIISLLLTLHSKLTSTPDSYLPFWERPEGQKIISDAASGIENGLELTHPAPPAEEQPGTSAEKSTDSVPSYAFSHAQLYKLLNPKTETESRIGDGAFFIGKVLDGIVAKDPQCREHLIQTRLRLWPKEAEDEEDRIRREAQEREEKKQKAIERRRKLMEEMAKQQRDYTKYMEKSTSEMEPGANPFLDTSEESNSADLEEAQIKAMEYDCVICNQTGPSTPTNPIGLVILLQASSLLGHRRGKGIVSRPYVIQ